jgi:hypothetical protein
MGWLMPVARTYFPVGFSLANLFEAVARAMCQAVTVEIGDNDLVAPVSPVSMGCAVNPAPVVRQLRRGDRWTRPPRQRAR